MTANSINLNQTAFQLYGGIQPPGKSQSTNFADTLTANLNSLNGKTINLYSDPDFVYAPQEPGGGCMSISGNNMLISVYKSADYSEDNPVMLVKGINSDGAHYEVEINVSDIDPRNDSLLELAAIEGYNAANGKGLPAVSSVIKAMSAQLFTGNNAYFDARADVFTKMDFIPAFLELMETQRYNGNWDGYMRFKEIIDSLLGVGMK